jgi:hypothetical protein
MSNSPPTAFVSYSWDNDAHRAWVAELAARLRADGVDVTLDRWHAVPGDQLPAFMERSIRERRYVLVICTPGYKQRADERRGGVGYEGDIITGEVASKGNHRKFIPVLRHGEPTDALPSWVLGKYFVDLRGDLYAEHQYGDLLSTLHDARVEAPALGMRPPSLASGSARASTPSLVASIEAPTPAFDPLRITGVVADEVTTPRMDGTRGSALYEVPFRLSRRPPSGWSELFVEAWNHPPSFSMMHRPGTADVVGDRIWLRRTTLQEVERHHRDTLVLALDVANRQYAELLDARREREAAERKREEEHRQSVDDAARRICFD